MFSLIRLAINKIFKYYELVEVANKLNLNFENLQKGLMLIDNPKTNTTVI